MSFLRKIFGKRVESEISEDSKHSANQSAEKSVYEKSVDIFFENVENPDLIHDKIFELTKSNQETTLIYLFIPHFFVAFLFPKWNGQIIMWLNMMMRLMKKLNLVTLKYSLNFMILLN